MAAFGAVNAHRVSGHGPTEGRSIEVAVFEAVLHGGDWTQFGVDVRDAAPAVDALHSLDAIPLSLLIELPTYKVAHPDGVGDEHRTRVAQFEGNPRPRRRDASRWMTTARQ